MSSESFNCEIHQGYSQKTRLDPPKVGPLGFLLAPFCVGQPPGGPKKRLFSGNNEQKPSSDRVHFKPEGTFVSENARSSGREVGIRITTCSVVYFDRGTLPPKKERAKGHQLLGDLWKFWDGWGLRKDTRASAPRNISTRPSKASSGVLPGRKCEHMGVAQN